MTYRHACLFVSALALISCGGGGSSSSDSTNPVAEGSAPNTESTEQSSGRSYPDSIIRTSEASSLQCPDGGVEIQLGIDSDLNGVLDDSEVDHSRTVTVCHGASNRTLFAIADASVEECPAGGSKLTIGWDENGDSSLSDSEVTEQHTLCQDKESSQLLVDTYATLANEDCEQGGEAVSIGFDLNDNGQLDDEEVTSTSGYCYNDLYVTLAGVKTDKAAVGEYWTATVTYAVYQGRHWEPDLELANAPSWMSILGRSAGYILVGGVPDSAGEFSATLLVSGGAVNDEVEIKGTAQHATVVSVVEVDNSSLAFELEEPLDSDLEIIYSLGDSASQYTSNYRPTVMIPAGDTRVEIPKTQQDGDLGASLFSLMSVTVHDLRSAGDYYLYAPRSTFFIPDSAPEWTIPAQQNVNRTIPCISNNFMYTYDYGYVYNSRECIAVDMSLTNEPEWLEVTEEFRLAGMAPTESIAEEGSISFGFTLTDGKQYSVEIPYRVVKPDADYDGVADVDDAFPEDPRYQNDSDNDGIADGWELWNVDDLATISATSDFNRDGISDLSAFQQGLPLNLLEIDFESGAMPSGWVADDWSVTDSVAYRGEYSVFGSGNYNNLSFPLEIQDSRIALRVFVPSEAASESSMSVNVRFRPVNGLGIETSRSFYLASEDAEGWRLLEMDVPAGRYKATISLYQYEGNNAQIYIDWITGIAGPTPGDADEDGIPNYLETYEQEMVAVEGDSDGDGIPDEDDAFPNDAAYFEDFDEDGMPDDWENQYGWYGDFYADDDIDDDGRSNLEEYLAGSSPVIGNLSVRPDIIRASSGQTITLAPHLNDGAASNTILVSIDAPANGSLILTNGEYRFTPPEDYVGWIVTEYTVTDGIDTDRGEIFIKVTDTIPPQLVKLVSGSKGASAALFDDGSLYMWGNNESGQLGNGTLSSSASPSLTMNSVTDVALRQSRYSGYEYVAVAKDDGSMWQWGGGVTTPGQVTLPEGVLAHQVAIEGNEIFIVTRTGALLRRYLSNAYTTEPVVQTVPLVKSISAGYDHVLILTRDGEVYSRGGNDRGQLGKGDNDYSSVWSPVSKLNVSIAQVSAGEYSSFAISDTGDLYAWGGNNYRQLGDGTDVDRNVPVLVASDIAQVAAGQNFSLFLTGSGDVLGSGYPTYAVLGRDCYDYPGVAQCLVGSSATYVAAGSTTSFIDRDGVTQVFGNNEHGLSGTGSYRERVLGLTVAWLQDAYIGGFGHVGFEGQSIPANWSNPGQFWEITEDDANTGNYSIKTSSTLDDYQTASLAIQTETGASSVRFKVRTSTEADYDELIFLIDGEEKFRLSGENHWADSGAFPVSAGLHTFEWRYTKDGGTSVGDDTVWLDDIEIPLDTDGDGILDSVDSEPNRYNGDID
jgi:hypothetical protein